MTQTKKLLLALALVAAAGNLPGWLELFYSLGVDGVFSDNADTAVAVRDRSSPRARAANWDQGDDLWRVGGRTRDRPLTPDRNYRSTVRRDRQCGSSVRLHACAMR